MESKIQMNLILTISKTCWLQLWLHIGDDKFYKPFRLYLGEDAVYNFINSMIGGSKYCSKYSKY